MKANAAAASQSLHAPPSGKVADLGDRIAELAEEAAARDRETDRRFRETDARIDKMISATGTTSG